MWRHFELYRYTQELGAMWQESAKREHLFIFAHQLFATSKWWERGAARSSLSRLAWATLQANDTSCSLPPPCDARSSRPAACVDDDTAWDQQSALSRVVHRRRRQPVQHAERSGSRHRLSCVSPPSRHCHVACTGMAQPPTSSLCSSQQASASRPYDQHLPLS